MNECQHGRLEIRRFVFNGGFHLCRQCLDCWQRVGSWLPKNTTVTSEVREFDRAAAEDGKRRIREELEHERRVEKREHLRAWREEEAPTYYTSELWSERRRLVLERDGGVCQGCLKAKATDVHHSTYSNWGSEFMFDLISLCRECHERLSKTLGHGRSIEDVPQEPARRSA